MHLNDNTHDSGALFRHAVVVSTYHMVKSDSAEILRVLLQRQAYDEANVLLMAANQLRARGGGERVRTRLLAVLREHEGAPLGAHAHLARSRRALALQELYGELGHEEGVLRCELEELQLAHMPPSCYEELALRCLHAACFDVATRVLACCARAHAAEHADTVAVAAAELPAQCVAAVRRASAVDSLVARAKRVGVHACG